MMITASIGLMFNIIMGRVLHHHGPGGHHHGHGHGTNGVDSHDSLNSQELIAESPIKDANGNIVDLGMGEALVENEVDVSVMMENVNV